MFALDPCFGMVFAETTLYPNRNGFSYPLFSR